MKCLGLAYTGFVSVLWPSVPLVVSVFMHYFKKTVLKGGGESCRIGIRYRYKYAEPLLYSCPTNSGFYLQV